MSLSNLSHFRNLELGFIILANDCNILADNVLGSLERVSGSVGRV
jgi:hypothetical protein